MDLDLATPRWPQAFTFTEYLNEETLEAHSCGNGRFIRGIPRMRLTVCFALTKTGDDHLDITIYDDSLIQWLRAIPTLRDRLDASEISRRLAYNGRDLSVSMNVLLPCYEELSAKFERYKAERRNFDALELFVRHFLRQLSVFSIFDLEHLRERQILTQQHFNDLERVCGSLPEDLCRLDTLIAEVDDLGEMNKPEFMSLFRLERMWQFSQPVITFGRPGNRLVGEPFRSALRTAIAARDSTTVAMLLATDRRTVHASDLCYAIRYYDCAIFRLLLSHGADVDGDSKLNSPLHDAAKAANMDAVGQLLEYGATTGGRCCWREVGPFTAYAICGGDLETVRCLVEERERHGCDDIGGDLYICMLSHAFEHRHKKIYDYLLRANLVLPRYNDQELPSSSSESVDCREFRNGNKIPVVKGSRHTWDILLSMGSSQEYLELVKSLVVSKLGVGSIRKESLLYRATVKGHLGLVRGLLKRAADVSAADLVLLMWHAADNGHLDVADFLLGCDPEIYPTFLATAMHLAAISGNHHAIVSLTRLGATINPLDNNSPLWSTVQCGHRNCSHCQVRNGTDVDGSSQRGAANDGICSNANDPRPRYCSRWNLIRLLERHQTKINDVEDCPAVDAVRDQERRATACRLLAHVESSWGDLLDLGSRHGASDALIAFVGQFRTRWKSGARIGQVRTKLFNWKSGTRAIREIIEGYMPSGLPDIVSALQVADAMRLAVQPSKMVCSEKEFVDDIPRWASLLSQQDQLLFFEIVSHLWGIPATCIYQERESNFDCGEGLTVLQELISKLLKTSGLFDRGIGNTCGTYGLQSLRELTFSMKSGLLDLKRHSLAEWNPSPTPEVQGSLRDAPGPPDPEEKHAMILTRITVLMAGAIFGAILIYLCLFRHGLSTLHLPNLAAGAGQDSASAQILTRNSVILAMYIGATFSLDTGKGRNDTDLPSKSHFVSTMVPSHLEDTARDNLVSYENNEPLVTSPCSDDVTMEDAPAECLHSPSSTPTTLPSATTISPSIVATATPGSSVSANSEDGMIRCEHCNSQFKLGVNGRRGQASNLQKHKRNHHPETIPGFHRVLHRCRWGCGATDPDRSNIKVHERQHCPKRKGKEPRRRGKWRETATGISGSQMVVID